MTIMTSAGQMANQLAKSIYRNQKTIVDQMVKAGKISANQANREYARRVARDLGRHGLKIPKWVNKMLR